MRALLAFLAGFFVSMAGARAAEQEAIKTLSFVLLTQPRLPAANVYRATLEARLQGRLQVEGMEAEGDKVILLRVRGGTVMLGLIDAPLPPGEVDGLCRTAWYWPTACADVARHQAHVIVSVMKTDLDRLDAALLQTDAVAALMDENAIASYWGASLHRREDVLAQSGGLSRSSPPVWLWVNFRLSNDKEKGWSISTQGMDAFGLMEIEARDVKRDGRATLGLLMNTAAYLVQKGPVIKDGETIGESAAQNIRVRHGPSYWREGATVYRIVFP